MSHSGEMGVLPDFEQPPVVEVALSLQFKPLESLGTSHLGLLWAELRRKDFSRAEDHGELEPSFEDFSATPSRRVGLRVQGFEDAPPPPRVWFLNEAQNELVQVQRDRFIVNWRQGAHSEPYPRYVSIRSRFIDAFGTFESFLSSEKLGAVVPNQCELTYVNHVPTGLGWHSHGEVDHVVTVWHNTYSDTYLSSPEDAAFRVRYRMDDEQGEALGRLHVAFQPAFRNADGTPIFAINLTGRGEPRSQDLKSSLALFDLEHQWIVRGFASITTPLMHEVWRRKDAR